MSIYKGEKLISGSASASASASAYPKPDWAKSVLLDHAGVYMDGYTAPSNGMIVGWFRFSNHIAALELKINSITVARATVLNSTLNSEGNVQCPVNKGDSIRLQATLGDVYSHDIDAALYFVPFIDGYTGN